MSRDRDVIEKVIASLRNIGQFEVSSLREAADGACLKAFDATKRITISIRTQWPNDRPDSDVFLQKQHAQARGAQNVEAGNLAKIIGSGELDGAFFIVSSFIDGHTLRENLRSGDRLGTSDLIDFARQSCDGIESAHSRGLVHHALHPENVAIEFDGSTKILDLGLYRRNDPQSDPFHPSSLYLAPEQLAGHGADRTTNFYSIALMLYEIATGRLPYEADGWEALLQSTERELVAPVKINSTIPPGINAVIVKALARDRSARFQSGPDLVRALEDYRSFGKKKVVSAPPVPVVAPSPIAVKPAKEAGSLATSTLTFANQTPAPVETGAPRLAVEAVMHAAQNSAAMAAGAGVGSSVSSAEITRFSAPPVPFKRTPAVVAPAPPLDELLPLQPAGPSKVALAKEALRNFAETTWDEAKTRFKKIDPWVIALTCVIVVLAGFITRTVALSFWGTPHAEDYTSTAPASPQPARAVAQTAAPVASAVISPVETAPAAAQPERKSAPVPRAETRHPRQTAQVAPKKPIITVVQPAAGPSVSSPYLGSVMISTTPDGARVVVDGKANLTFTTPQVISLLSPGVHTLTITKDGYAAATRSIQITAGARSNLAVQLALPPAYLTVLSNPTDAYILIDGVSTGHVTPSQVPVAPGTHTVTLRKMGYLEANDTVSMTAGQQQSRNLSLLEAGSTPDIRVAQTGKVKKLFGAKISGVRLSVHTEPAGATVLINGQAVPKSTPVDFGLNPGNYVMEIQLEGHQTLRKTITVQDGNPLVLNETLHP